MFGEIIHAYTRSNAIEDGYLVDVTREAARAGFRFPVAVTRAVWEDCIEWGEDDDERKGECLGQSRAGRLHDVLVMAAFAAKRGDGDCCTVSLLRVPREGKATGPQRVDLTMTIGPGDTAAPVITIMQPGED